MSDPDNNNPFTTAANKLPEDAATTEHLVDTNESGAIPLQAPPSYPSNNTTNQTSHNEKSYYAPPPGGPPPTDGQSSSPSQHHTYAPPPGAPNTYAPPAGSPYAAYNPPPGAPPAAATATGRPPHNTVVYVVDDPVMNNAINDPMNMSTNKGMPMAFICFIFGICTWFGFLFGMFFLTSKDPRERAWARACTAMACVWALIIILVCVLGNGRFYNCYGGICYY